MNERAWRSLAGLALDDLDAMPLTGDEKQEVRAGLERALALPGSAASVAVWEVLSSRPVLLDWLRDHAGPDVRRPFGLTPAGEENPTRGPAPAPVRGGGHGSWRDLGLVEHLQPQRQVQQQEHRGRPAGPPRYQHAEPPSEEPAPEPETRTVYPRLDAPPSVPAGSTFRITVGLADRASERIVAPSFFQVPVTPFDLTMTLLVHGFRIADGDGPQRTVRSNAATPYPGVDVLLEAIDDRALTRARSILVEYSVEGRLLGVATTSVDVRSPGQEPAPAVTAAAPSQDWSLPSTDAPDVTITIARGNDLAGGTFQWSVKTPLPVDVPDRPLISDLGARPKDWADTRTRTVEARAGTPNALRDYLSGIFAEVGDVVPAGIWPTLRAAAGRVGHPTVLVVSAEPYVPWELAAVPDPWDPDRPALLGAQAHVGRWTYRDQGEEPCPAHTIDVGSLAVVVGRYAGSAALPEAEGEADDLARAYAAPPVPAEREALKRAILGDPDADVLHFAGHGRFSSSGGQDGILLDDRTMFSRTDVRGLGRARPRLVFLNACQVGQQDEELGLPAGLAPAFCWIGVQAVVAPLWKVDDAAARSFAQRFYAALLAGRPPAEFLAEERTRALRGDGSDLTALAYLLFGHPRLVAHDRRGTAPPPDAVATTPLLRGGR